MQSNKHFRSKKLLDAARGEPCVLCGDIGTTVSCHANSVALGKGTGIKVPDYYVAWLCDFHHGMVDGRYGRLTKEEKFDLWVKAYLLTVGRWFTRGTVKVC